LGVGVNNETVGLQFNERSARINANSALKLGQPTAIIQTPSPTMANSLAKAIKKIEWLPGRERIPVLVRRGGRLELTVANPHAA